jgi:hypothetical protein
MVLRSELEYEQGTVAPGHMQNIKMAYQKHNVTTESVQSSHKEDVRRSQHQAGIRLTRHRPPHPPIALRLLKVETLVILYLLL